MAHACSVKDVTIRTRKSSGVFFRNANPPKVPALPPSPLRFTPPSRPSRRFHLVVMQELGANPPDVVEYRQPLSLRQFHVSISCAACLSRKNKEPESFMPGASPAWNQRSLDLVCRPVLEPVWSRNSHRGIRTTAERCAHLRATERLTNVLPSPQNPTFHAHIVWFRAVSERIQASIAGLMAKTLKEAQQETGGAAGLAEITSVEQALGTAYDTVLRAEASSIFLNSQNPRVGAALGLKGKHESCGTRSAFASEDQTEQNSPSI